MIKIEYNEISKKFDVIRTETLSFDSITEAIESLEVEEILSRNMNNMKVADNIDILMTMFPGLDPIRLAEKAFEIAAKTLVDQELAKTAKRTNDFLSDSACLDGPEDMLIAQFGAYAEEIAQWLDSNNEQ
jgi:hypothetical protein